MMVTRPSRPLLFASLLALAVIGPPVRSEEPERPRLTRDECRILIEKLANPEKPPFATRSVNRLPEGVAHASLFRRQRPIAEAYNDLSRNADVALPLLAASFGDERFSYVYEGNGPYHTQTVGGACRWIVDAHVNVYSDVVRKVDPATGRGGFWLTYEPDPIGNKDLSWARRELKELQLERIEWARSQQQPKEFSDVEWQEALRKLGRMANEIRSTGKAIRVDHRIHLLSK